MISECDDDDDAAAATDDYDDEDEDDDDDDESNVYLRIALKLMQAPWLVANGDWRLNCMRNLSKQSST